MERGTTGASASQNHVAGIITTLGATWRTHGDGRIIFPRAPPWRARGYPVPAMLFGGEARAAVNLPSSLRGPLRPLLPSQCLSTAATGAYAASPKFQGKDAIWRNETRHFRVLRFLPKQTLPSSKSTPLAPK